MRIHNKQEFFDDIKRADRVMVITPRSGAYLHVKKSEVKKRAERSTILYRMDNTIFTIQQDVMIIL